jgi:hypothetical protein
MRHVLDAHQVQHDTYYTERADKKGKIMSGYCRDVTPLRSRWGDSDCDTYV